MIRRKNRKRRTKKSFQLTVLSRNDVPDVSEWTVEQLAVDETEVVVTQVDQL